MLRDIIGSGPINIILVIAASEPKEISTITAGTTTKGGAGADIIIIAVIYSLKRAQSS